MKNCRELAFPSTDRIRSAVLDINCCADTDVSWLLYSQLDRFKESAIMTRLKPPTPYSVCNAVLC